MNQFGTKMKQKYKEYNGQEPITTLAGERYPDDLSKRTFKLYSDNSKKTETIIFEEGLRLSRSFYL